MSRKKQETTYSDITSKANKMLNFYISNTCLKSSDSFKVLPSCENLSYYEWLINEADFNVNPALKQFIIESYQEKISYIHAEQAFRENLSPEQIKQFDELRKKIVEWYDIQKELLKFTIKRANSLNFI